MKNITVILVMVVVFLGTLSFPLTTTSARDIVEYEVASHIIWMNPVAWNTLNYDFKIKIIKDFGEAFKDRPNLYRDWTYKEMGTSLKLATFELCESGARKIKILVN